MNGRIDAAGSWRPQFVIAQLSADTDAADPGSAVGSPPLGPQQSRAVTAPRSRCVDGARSLVPGGRRTDVLVESEQVRRVVTVLHRNQALVGGRRVGRPDALLARLA